MEIAYNSQELIELLNKKCKSLKIEFRLTMDEISMIAKNKTITTLDIRYNNIGDEGAKELAKNSTITNLNIRGNKIGDEGAKELAKIKQ